MVDPKHDGKMAKYKAKPSEQAKASGLKNLKQVAGITGKKERTLINWCNDSPELFEVVLLGCAAKLGLVT
jgi:hypothetical protein